MKSRRAVQFGSAVLIALGLFVSRSIAEQISWFGMDSSWENISNWDAHRLPGTSDSLQFISSGVPTTSISASHAVEDLTVTSGNHVIDSVTGVSGNTISINSHEGGTQTLSVTKFSSGPSSLTLGGANPVNLVTNNLSVLAGASLTVRNGSTLTLGEAFNSVPPTFSSTINGSVTVDGTGSKLVVFAHRQMDNTDYPIGQQIGTGTPGASLTSLTFQNASTANSILGDIGIGGPATNASLNVTGGSSLTVAGNIFLYLPIFGASNAAVLNIDGPASTLTQTSNYLNQSTSIEVGPTSSSKVGSATVNVAATQSGSTLTTGGAGMEIYQLGAVNVGSAIATGTFNCNGGLNVTGGTLRVYSGSAFNLAPGKTLTIQAGAVDLKSIDLNGSIVNFTGGSLSYAGNLLVGAGGLLGTNLALNSSKQLAITGALTVDATRKLTINGGVQSARDTTIGAESTLAFGLSGNSKNQYGLLVSSNLFSAAGILQITLLNGYSPAYSSIFQILDFATESGVFSSINLPTLSPGLAWDTSQLYMYGRLSVGTNGDFNGDGVVDAADYTVWRDGLGSRYTQPDYLIWKNNFGKHFGGASISDSTAIVPAPTSGICALAALMTVVVSAALGNLTGHWPMVARRWEPG
jgi:hypothetical protein